MHLFRYAKSFIRQKNHRRRTRIVPLFVLHHVLSFSRFIWLLPM